MDKGQLERFLLEVLPPLEYLEMSCLSLPEDIMHKASEKFKQIVIFGSPDLPHNKRQHLNSTYNISVSILFARDFPINMAGIEAETEIAVHNVGLNGAASTTNSRARVLASSNSSTDNYTTGASANSPTKRANNNKMGAKPDTRLSRDPLRGELKFKQIKLTNKKTHYEVNLLVRRQ